MLARAAFAMDHHWSDGHTCSTFRRLDAAQMLAVTVAVVGFDYSHGRAPPSDPQCIPVVSFKESHGLRVAVLCPERHLRSVQGAPALRRRDRLPASARSPHADWPALLFLRRQRRRARRRGASASIYSTPPLPLQRGRPTTHTKATPHSRPSSATTRGTPS